MARLRKILAEEGLLRTARLRMKKWKDEYGYSDGTYLVYDGSKYLGTVWKGLGGAWIARPDGDRSRGSDLLQFRSRKDAAESLLGDDSKGEYGPVFE